jgi:hypothetical protein
MLRKTIHSKLKGEIAATFAAGLVILVATGAQAKDSAHHQNSNAQDNHTSQQAVGVHSKRHRHKTTVTGPVHGPGSSHNPIVYHPVHGTGSSHNPIVNPTVRDHRGDNAPPVAPPNCGSFAYGACGGHPGHSKDNPDVRDHRNDPIPCLGNLC